MLWSSGKSSYSRFVTRALDQCTFAVWVLWRVMCHSESWQKGEEEEEVDKLLHDVDKDPEAASSLKGWYEDLESVLAKEVFFIILLFFIFFLKKKADDGWGRYGRNFFFFFHH